MYFPTSKHATRKAIFRRIEKCNYIVTYAPQFREMPSTRRKTYATSDYHSNDGMLTTVWGPGIWHYLHTMSFNYPVSPTPEEKQHYRNFVLELRYVLPCGKCRKNLEKTFKKLPLTMAEMQSRDTFSKYIYDLHETVNKMLDKKSGLSYADVRERYEHFRARCVQQDDQTGGGKQIARRRRTSKVTTRASKTKKDEIGCVVPLYGKKARCILQIVPQEVKSETIQIDGRCIKKLVPQFTT